MAVFKITLSAKLNSLGLYKSHVNASLKKNLIVQDSVNILAWPKFGQSKPISHNQLYSVGSEKKEGDLRMKQEADKNDIKSCWKRDAGKKFAFFKKGKWLY